MAEERFQGDKLDTINIFEISDRKPDEILYELET
jgi:hypothetical protein